VPGLSISDVSHLQPFEYRWPQGLEAFEGGWAYTAEAGGRHHPIRHAIGARRAFGRTRVRTVTWIGGEAQVEGVEADDYPVSQSLLSRLRSSGRVLARTPDQVPAGYERFEIVEHWRELDAPYSPFCLAVKLREDDLPGWAGHAWLRSLLPRRPGPASRPATPPRPPAPLPPPPAPDARAVGRALLAHGDALARRLGGGTGSLAQDVNGSALIRQDAFAFLVAVIADLGVPAEQAWSLPLRLSQRLGGLSPARLHRDPAAVRGAVRQPPPLHRFTGDLPDWLVRAAEIILERYGGQAERLWLDRPTAMELRRRLEAFPGMSPAKAAGAVEILAGELGKPVRELSGNDVAHDAHLRRVFLRTGLARQDDVSHMVAVASGLFPGRPAAVSLPAWDIGRRWCRPASPDCPACPIRAACARLIQAGSRVRGLPP